MNSFVDYLNSIHTISGDSTGSLAEKQVNSPFFDVIKVDRKFGNYITDNVRNNTHMSYILTGHAGDGKTSVLAQVLKSLNRLPEGKELLPYHEYTDLFYVKDMSEIAEDDQVDILIKALESPLKNQTSILISNTGPLLNTFMRIARLKAENQGNVFNEKDEIEIQSILLRQLDQNNDTAVEVVGYKFILVNIARIDNVSLSTHIFRNILKEELWGECQECVKRDTCPIKYNRDCTYAQIDRVSSFIEGYYRYLYENDKRMTVRQMIGQLSYALTGNLTCEQIHMKMLKKPKFRYNFANLFFGYVGLDKSEHVQIEGVKQIQMLNIDGVALTADYDLFVKQDYTCFTPEIRKEILDLNFRYRKIYQSNNYESEKEQHNRLNANLRRSIRRHYMMYSQHSDELAVSNVLNQVFGAMYTDYVLLIKKQESNLRKIQDTVFKALYVKNTGYLPNDETELPLTLRRNDDVYQSVMLVLGSINKKDIKVVQIPVTNRFEDAYGKQLVALNIKGKHFPLTLPMISYFGNLISGAISSYDNPALTHGIASLEALLVEQCSEHKAEVNESCEITVLISKTTGLKRKHFIFEDNKINVE